MVVGTSLKNLVNIDSMFRCVESLVGMNGVTSIPSKIKDFKIFEHMFAEDVSGVLVVCDITQDNWICDDMKCFDEYFLYKEDLFVYEFNKLSSLWEAYSKHNLAWDLGIRKSPCSYILDNPASESYELYSNTKDISAVYGKINPRGTNLIKCADRFERDQHIRVLEEKYSCSNKKLASMLSEDLKSNQAVIISDGCLMEDVCCYAFYSITHNAISNGSEIITPSNTRYSVLIAELLGLMNGIKNAVDSGVNTIDCYSDNVQITGNNEHIKECRDFLDFLKECKLKKVKVMFHEIHPKSSECKKNENKARIYFHNACHHKCREMVMLFKKSYGKYVYGESSEGVDLCEAMLNK